MLQPKKVFVKAPKKMDSEVNESPIGDEKEPKTEAVNGKPFVNGKQITEQEKQKINEISSYNTKVRGFESDAKKDSINAAKTAKINGKDLVDQRRIGNQAANKSRDNNNIPKVTRGRSMADTDGVGGVDKYAGDTTNTFKTDYYGRDKPLEKEFLNLSDSKSTPKSSGKIFVKKTKQ